MTKTESRKLSESILRDHRRKQQRHLGTTQKLYKYNRMKKILLAIATGLCFLHLIQYSSTTVSPQQQKQQQPQHQAQYTMYSLPNCPYRPHDSIQTIGVQLEAEGFKTEDLGTQIDPRDHYSMLDCPISLAVDTDNCGDNSKIQALKKHILANITVCRWFKDRKPFHRTNGNVFQTQLWDTPNSIALFQVNDLDAGIYNCTLDYSRVNIKNYDISIRQCLILYPSVEFGVDINDPDSSPPAIGSQITHPPAPVRATPGQDVVFTCNHIDTLMAQRVDWFRSRCNITQVETYDNCKKEFTDAYIRTSRLKLEPELTFMMRYFIQGDDGETLTIKNVTQDDVDTYGCMVSNKQGLDIRIAELTLDYMINGSRNIFPSPIPPRVDNVQQQAPHNDQQGTVLIIFAIIILLLIALCYTLCNTKYGLKLMKSSLFFKELATKENPQRQHLPKVESPNIYNIDQSDECYIYGSHHQKNGHLLDQSMCSPTLINQKNLSISSNNYQSDESSSLGKSLSSTGDNGRTFYHHTSSTATTVPLYDHLPSALIQGSCVMNPTYGILRPNFEETNPKWTFSRRHLEPQGMIGKGQFGEVWRYVAHQKDGTANFVAVKKLTVRNGQERYAKDEILKEIEIMKKVNDHPNVIKFLNTCGEPTTILLIMEYAENGTLQTYLRNCRCSKDKGAGTVTSKELLKYSYHVAKGMEYIASKGIVHRDLATRNVLLSKEKICKIADFGLARFVGDCGIYQRLDRNQPVPIKWMAPESLMEFGTYTSKSDVFSVGVLMWEIVTLGATPYDFLPSNEVLKKVVSGGRLARPEHCREEFYRIMDRCWHQDPTKRPTFIELADELEVLLQSENDYIQLDKYPEHAYYNINTNENAEKEMVTTTPLPIYPELVM